MKNKKFTLNTIDDYDKSLTHEKRSLMLAKKISELLHKKSCVLDPLNNVEIYITGVAGMYCEYTPFTHLINTALLNEALPWALTDIKRDIDYDGPEMTSAAFLSLQRIGIAELAQCALP